MEAPDILYNQTSNDTITMEGASVTLNCEARGYPEPTVTWQREDKQPIVIRDTGGQGGAMRGQNCTQGRKRVNNAAVLQYLERILHLNLAHKFLY